MRQNYPRKLFQSTKGRLFILINEMRMIGEDKNFDGVKISGTPKVFREKYISDKVLDFIEQPDRVRSGGLLWRDESTYNYNELLRIARKAKTEAANNEFGQESARLINLIIDEMDKPRVQVLEKKKEEKVDIDELKKKAEEAEEIRKQKRAEKAKVIEKEEMEEELGIEIEDEDIKDISFDDETTSAIDGIKKIAERKNTFKSLKDMTLAELEAELEESVQDFRNAGVSDEEIETYGAIKSIQEEIEKRNADEEEEELEDAGIAGIEM